MKELSFESIQGKVLWKALLLEPEDTGLNNNVMAYRQKSKAVNNPFIKYQINPTESYHKGRFQSMNIDASPVSEDFYQSTDKGKVAWWVRRNRALLHDLWEDKISNDQLKERLQIFN